MTLSATTSNPTNVIPRPILTTVMYYAAFVALGMAAAVLGPTLPGLAHNTHSPLSLISYIFTARAFGYLIGAILAGRLYDRVTGHALLAIMAVGMAIGMAVVPLATQLWLLIAILLLFGISEALVDVGANAMLTWVHGANTGPYMNGLHFFFAVGAWLSPLVAAWVLIWSGGISWVYWIVALILLPIALFASRLPSPPSPGHARHGVQERPNYLLVGLISLFLVCVVGYEVVFSGWIFTYARAYNFSETTAAYLNSAFFGAFMLARLISIPLAVRLRPRTLLLADLLAGLLSVVIILLWPRSEIALWIGVIGAGAAVASLFPIIITWAERRMTLSGSVTSWFFVGAGLGGMSFPWFVGQLFESFGAQITMLTVLGSVLAGLIVFVLLMLVGGPPRQN